MIKVNRTTEYGLIALRYMNRRRLQESRGVTSAREIADHFGLPFEITAKTLQRLKDTGLIQSEQGARGGYSLQRSLDEVTLAEFLQLMEGPQSLVACASQAQAAEKSADSCAYHGKCEIKGMMSDLNARVLKFLSTIRLGELGEGMEIPMVQITPMSAAPFASPQEILK